MRGSFPSQMIENRGMGNAIICRVNLDSRKMLYIEVEHLSFVDFGRIKSPSPILKTVSRCSDPYVSSRCNVCHRFRASSGRRIHYPDLLGNHMPARPIRELLPHRRLLKANLATFRAYPFTLFVKRAPLFFHRAFTAGTSHIQSIGLFSGQCEESHREQIPSGQ